MYEIIYNSEVIDTAKDTYEACELVKEYRIAFKSGNVWYRRGDTIWQTILTGQQSTKNYSSNIVYHKVIIEVK